MPKSGEVAASTPNTSDLVAALLQRAPRVAMGLAAVQAAVPLAKDARKRYRDATAYRIKVTAADEIYETLHEWVLSLLPSDKQRALVAWTVKRDMSGMGTIETCSPDGGQPKPPPRVRLRYDGSREQTITVGGHTVLVTVNDAEGSGQDRGYGKPAEIVFVVHSKAGQQAMLEAIGAVAADYHTVKREPSFRMLTRWGDWTRLDDLPPRTLDSVVLPDGQLERLVEDVGRFLGAEDQYLRRCIPWHRGHLYEGPPGTGKTSVARALASHFGMDLWYLPLADLERDCDLISALNRIGPRSMLLLEDVDVFHAATLRSESDKGVTLSGLLNALDGIATPHGLLTVMTTNVPDVLDSALLRPGRVDLREHFGLADREQIARLLQRWYADDEVPSGWSISLGASMPPAEVVELCKRCETFEAAVMAVNDATWAATEVHTLP